MHSILQTINLTKVYPSERGALNFWSRRPNHSVLALDHVNLKVERGELFGLLGMNGAGKTTLIKILCGLLLPTKGTASIDGFNVVKDRLAVLKKAGVMLPELRGFYWRLKGRENLEIYSRLYAIRNMKQKVQDTLRVVGLSEDQGEMRFQEYSSGMKQRLALAKTLLPESELLLLDEPTSELDVRGAIEIRALIKEQLNQKERKTIFLTTHNMNEAEQLCERIAVLHKGRIIAVGSPEEIRQAAKPVSVLLLEVSPKTIDQRLRELNGVIDVSSKLTQERMALEIIVEKGMDLSSIIRLVSNETKIFKINSVEPSLEEALLQLTGGAKN